MSALQELRDLAKEFNQVFGFDSKDALADAEMWLVAFAAYGAGKRSLDTFNELAEEAMNGETYGVDDWVKIAMGEYDA